MPNLIRLFRSSLLPSYVPFDLKTISFLKVNLKTIIAVCLLLYLDTILVAII
jgi:hypothetical protein